MRRALALLATIGAFMMLTVGIASAQEYPGTTATSTTVPGTETVTPTTVPRPTTPPTTSSGVAAGGATAGETLPATGNDSSLPLAQLAIVLVAAGGIALLAVRRQDPAQVNTDR